jgi:hypothetical protein
MATTITKRSATNVTADVTRRVTVPAAHASVYNTWAYSWGASWTNTWRVSFGHTDIGQTVRVSEAPASNVTKRVSL